MTGRDDDDRMTIPQATDWLLNQPGLVLVAPDDRGVVAVFGTGHRIALARLLPRIEPGDDDDGVEQSLAAMLTGIATIPSASSDELPSEQDIAETDRQQLMIGWLDTVALLQGMLDTDNEAIAAALEGVAASPAAGRLAINLAFALLSELSTRMNASEIAAMFEALRRGVIDGEFPGADATGGDD